jgi:trehalose 6-phosphate phosphatase
MTAPLRDDLDNLAPVLLEGPPPIVLLDFDGTLAPIVEDPARARMPETTAVRIRDLIDRRRATVGIISGRALDELRRLAPWPGSILAGNHGMEMSGPGWDFLHQEAQRLVPVVAAAGERLRQVCDQFDGAWVEDKGLTVTLHYRRVEPGVVSGLLDASRRALDRMPESASLRAVAGRRVLEVRPAVDWDKGRACVWILARIDGRQDRTVYIGDDRTDEDAFRALPDAVTVKIGVGRTAAKYYVEDEPAAAGFLEWLARGHRSE